MELIKEKRRRIPSYIKYPKYNSEDEGRDYYDNEFRRRTAQNPYRISHPQILDDYPPSDFTFHGEHEPELNQEHEEEFNDYNTNVASVQSSGKKSLEEIPIEKSAEFAYSPFDPRYHENASTTGI